MGMTSPLNLILNLNLNPNLAPCPTGTICNMHIIIIPENRSSARQDWIACGGWLQEGEIKCRILMGEWRRNSSSQLHPTLVGLQAHTHRATTT